MSGSREDRQPARREQDEAGLLLRRIRGGRKGWFRLLLVTLVTAGVFYFLSTRIDYGQVGRTLRGADLRLAILSFSMTGLFPVLSSLRWRRMLRALGYDISFRDCFDMIMAAWPMGTITPSKSGDLMKAYYLKDRVPVPLVLGSVLAERALDVLVLLALALAGCLAFGRMELALLAGLCLAGGIGAILLLLHVRLPVPRKLQDKVDPMLRSCRQLVGSPALLGTVVLYTILNWGSSIVQMVLAYHALGVHVPLLFAAGALPLAIFVGLLPVTLSGIGTRDAAIIALFAPYASGEVSLGVGILYSLFGYWIPAVIGLPFLHRVLPRDRKR